MSWTRPVYGLAAVAFAATVALASEPAPIVGSGPYPPMQQMQFQSMPAGVPGPYPYIPNAPVIGPAPGQPGGLPTRMLAPQVPYAPQLPQFAPPQAPFIPPSPQEEKQPNDQPGNPPQPGAPNNQTPPAPGLPGAPGDPKAPSVPPMHAAPPTVGAPVIKHWIPPAPGPDGTLQVDWLAPVPCMIGSSIDYFYRPLLNVNRTFGVTPIGTVAPTAGASGILQGVVTQSRPTPAGTTLVGGTPQTVILIPDLKLMGMRIADNESPQPQNRVFFNYHYFQGVASDPNTNPLAVFRQPDGTLLQAGGQTVAVPIGGVQQRVMVGTFGLEKTLPDNPNVSFGLRVPVYNVANSALFTDPLSTTDVGDITGIFKLAAINDPCTGCVLSTGVAVTVPIGERTIAFNGDKLDSVLVQPYLGFLWDCERCVYVQAFSSVSLPIDGPEPILLFNDIGIGWWAYESNWFWLQGIIPTVEAHATTPLEQRGDNTRSTRVFDSLVGTAGVHFLCGCGSTFTIGGSTPFMGPRPFDYELFAQINFRF